LWGHNNYGQLGLNNTTTPQKSPVQPFDFGSTSGQINGVMEIAMSPDSTLFLREDGTVWSVGRNRYGEIGNTTIGASSSAKTQVSVQVMAPGTNAGEYLGVNTPKITSIASRIFYIRSG
jgi:alpha-tubulin suppressor-like RCC1 family protein